MSHNIKNLKRLQFQCYKIACIYEGNLPLSHWQRFSQLIPILLDSGRGCIDHNMGSKLKSLTPSPRLNLSRPVAVVVTISILMAYPVWRPRETAPLLRVMETISSFRIRGVRGRIRTQLSICFSGVRVIDSRRKSQLRWPYITVSIDALTRHGI